MRRFLVVIERAPSNFSGYLPDLPGCVATGDTEAEVIENMRVAMVMHLEGLAEDGLPIPEPAARAEYVSVPEAS